MLWRLGPYRGAMTKPIDEDAELRAELDGLTIAHGVVVERHDFRRSGFVGHDQLLHAYKFIIETTFAGIFKKLGEDVWERLRRVASRILRQSHRTVIHQVSVEVRLSDARAGTRFVCEARLETDLSKWESFRVALVTEVQRDSDLKNFPPAAYRLSDSGLWINSETD